MKQSTIEEVKEYFKDALVIKDRCGDLVNVKDFNSTGIYKHDFYNSYYVDDTFSNCFLLFEDGEGYAEITKYKPKKDFKTITESITELFRIQNNKYGKSALNPIEIFNGKTKVGQRLDDKISRVKNSDVLRKNDIADIIGYLILVCQENGWNNFDEFKD